MYRRGEALLFACCVTSGGDGAFTSIKYVGMAAAAPVARFIPAFCRGNLLCDNRRPCPRMREGIVIFYRARARCS